MRRTLIALAAAGLLVAGGCSDSDSGDPTGDEESADNGDGESSGGGDSEDFCADFQALDDRFSADPEASEEEVIEALESLDPPEEIADDFATMIEVSRSTSNVDQSDPEAMADAQAELEGATEAQTRVFTYLDEECGVGPEG